METNTILQNDSLWSRLQKFSLDSPDVDLPFSKKLAKEENWTLDFTKKAIEEYKKFVYLCCILPDGASPSETVDKVWHMHLMYTQNYWEEFCPEILKRKLHHHPSKGGVAEKSRHKKWFGDTLASYREIFNQDAPQDIWNNNVKPSGLSWFKRLKLVPFFALLLMMTSCLGEVINTLAAMMVLVISIFFLLGFFSWIFGGTITKNPKNGNNTNSDGGSCATAGGSCSGGGSCGGGCGGCGGCGG
ncbi:MAG: glycine-rich domain-containing protein [Sphingobacterium sp.]